MPELAQFLGSALSAMLVGGFGPLVGVALGWDPLIVYVGATAGSLAFMWLVIFKAAGLRDRIVRRFSRGDTYDNSTVRRLYERFGEIGLATFVPIVLGPTVALAAAAVLGVDRPRFARWYAASTAIGFAIITAFWALVL